MTKFKILSSGLGVISYTSFIFFWYESSNWSKVAKVARFRWLSMRLWGLVDLSCLHRFEWIWVVLKFFVSVLFLGMCKTSCHMDWERKNHPKIQEEQVPKKNKERPTNLFYTLGCIICFYIFPQQWEWINIKFYILDKLCFCVFSQPSDDHHYQHSSCLWLF